MQDRNRRQGLDGNRQKGANKSEKRKNGRDRATVERKMALAQHIRQENLDNRMKIRQRENILYGGSAAIPLWEKGQYGQNITDMPIDGNNRNEPCYGKPPELPAGTFKYRMAIAVLLFVGFLVCDTNGQTLGSYSMDDIHEMIVADTFHLNDGGDGMADGLAQLFEFGR